MGMLCSSVAGLVLGGRWCLHTAARQCVHFLAFFTGALSLYLDFSLVCPEEAERT